MIKLLLLAVVPFMTQHRNVVPKTEVSTNFYGSVTGVVDKAYIEARVGAGGGGGCDTNAVDILANSAVVTNAITVATTNRVAALETAMDEKANSADIQGMVRETMSADGISSSRINIGGSISGQTIGDQYGDLRVAINGKADKSALAAHIMDSSNPHGVTAEQIGAVPFVEDVNGNKTAVTIGSRLSGGIVGPGSFAHGDGVYAEGNCSHAAGYRTSAIGDYSSADGGFTEAIGYWSHASGIRARTRQEDASSYAWNGNGDPDYGAYYSHGPGTFNINPLGGLNGFYIGEQTLHAILTNKADKAEISATNPTFSNAVLAVGLNIDTNSVAVLNEIASTFGGFPIEGTATTVGGLLAALAAAAAWLKKNKVQTLKLEDGSVETSADGGVAKLDDFFTESNSLLTGRVNNLIDAKVGEVNVVLSAALDGTEVA